MKLIETRKQWVDLGVQTQACLVLRATCGPEGSAVALWLYVHNCNNLGGIITSYDQTSGMMIQCISALEIRYGVFFGLKSSGFDTQVFRMTSGS